MVSRYYRDRLHAVLTSANDESIDTSATDWSTNAFLLQGVAMGIRASSIALGSELEGNTGRAMVANFKTISDKLEQDSADMAKGAGALVLAHTGAIEAIKARNGIMLSGPMNQPPTKPEGPTPGIKATPEQEAAMGDYNTQVAQYEANEAAMEENARVALVQMDQQYAEATVIMKEIHGEPDPVDPTPSTPTRPSGPGYAPPPPITGKPGNKTDHGLAVIKNNHGGHVTAPVIPGYEPGQPEGIIIDCTGLTPTNFEVLEPIHEPPNFTHNDPIGTPSTNVTGTTDGGTSYQGSGSIGSSSAPGTSSVTGGVSAGSGGAVAAGAAGIGLGAGAIKGGGITPPGAPSSGAVRGIGAGGRPSAPGALGKGVTAAGTSSATSKGSAGRAGAASGASRSGAGSRAGAAGANGSASRSSAAKGGTRSGAASGATRSGAASKGAKGKGLFRRGNNGSVTGGRSNKKKDDERSTERDALVYEQDWLGDDATAPGVLD